MVEPAIKRVRRRKVKGQRVAEVAELFDGGGAGDDLGQLGGDGGEK